MPRGLGLVYGSTPAWGLHRYDLRFVQAKADGIDELAEFAEPARSKPLILFVKAGSELARVEGANPVELGKLVSQHASKKA